MRYLFLLLLVGCASALDQETCRDWCESNGATYQYAETVGADSIDCKCRLRVKRSADVVSTPRPEVIPIRPERER